MSAVKKITSPAAQPVYTVKAIKTFRAMEGQGFNATLCRDGKPVAHVDDEGNGGCYHWSWMDRTAPRVPVSTLNFKDEVVTFQGTPEEAAFHAFVMTLPPIPSPFADEAERGETMRVSDEIFVGDLVSRVQAEKRLKTMLAKKTVIVKDKRIYTFNQPISDPIRAHIRKKDGDAAVILNDMPFEKALEIALPLGL